MTHTISTGAPSRVDQPTADDQLAAEQEPSGQLGDVRADHVEIVQGGAQAIHAQTVTIQQGGAGLVRATEVTVSQGGIGVARAERVSLRETSSAFALVSREASVGAGSNILLLVARDVRGDIRPLVDWRAAAAFGAALALVTTILRRR